MSPDAKSSETIFGEAIAIESPDERAAFLDHACQGDRDLRRELEKLVADHFRAGSFLESPAVEPQPTVTLEPITERPGTVIGHYKLLEQIGEGGFGVVFMAEQQEPVRRKVALKIIKPGMDTREVIARFEAERQALAIMDHPNIAKVLDAGATESGRPYFVMELVRGIPITAFCDQNSLTTRERLELFAAVCRAVQHAHQKGIIHRDIKPSNVLVTMHDDRPVPKVIDFGVAKATNARLTERTLFTRFAQMVGTPLYMSPEQAQMSGLDIDTRSDTYSLGVLLYELLTGTTPFDQKRMREAAYDEMLRIIREEEPPRPSLRISTLGDTLPSVAAQRKVEPKKLSALVRGELDWIVMKALEKDRTRRYETANGLARDIERYLHDEPVQACPPSVAYRFKKFARRNKVAITTAMLIAAALLIGTAISTWQAIRATRAAVAEQQAREEADAEQQRAEGNLDLALKALDAVYLDAIGKEKLLGNPVAKRGEPGSLMTEPPPLSALERELLKRGLAFYDQFAAQNATAPRAFVRTAQAYYRVGLLHAALGDAPRAAEAYREAIRRFEELTEEEPQNAEYLRQLGEAYQGLANAVPDWDAAKKILANSVLAYSKAIELRADDAMLYLSRGNALWVLSDKRAVQDFEKAIQLDPHNVNAFLRCSNYYRTGRVVDPQKAREYAERAVALAPDDPMCHIQLARVLGEVSVGSIGPRANAAAALEQYARAIQLAPDFHAAYRERGAFYYQIGDNPRALADLNRALELKPDDYWVFRWRVGVLRELGQFDEALADVATFIKFQPHAWVAYDSMGRIHERMKNWQAAVDALSKAVEINPWSCSLFRRRAFAHANLGQYAQALADLKKALELDSKYTAVLWQELEAHLTRAPEEFGQGLLELARDAVQRSPQPAQAYADRGQLYFLMKDYDKAEADFAKAAELGSQSANVWRQLGEFRLQRQNWQAAVDAFTKALEIGPSTSSLFANRALAHVNLGQYAQALADLRKTLDLNPKATDVLLWAVPGPQLARSPEKFRQGLLELARDALSGSPQPAKAYADRGELYCRMKDYAKAEADFAEVIDLQGDKVLALTRRGACYCEQGQWGKAAADYAKAIELSPDNVLARCWRALTHLATEDVAGYRQACADLLTRPAQTNDPMMANFVAWTAALMPGAVDDYGPCITLASKAVEARPDDDQFLNTLGAILYRMGRHPEAVKRLTELEGRRKDSAPGAPPLSPAYTWYFLAMAYHQLGQQEKAKEYLAKAIARTEQELADSTDLPLWNRRLTLQLLRKEAEALITQAKPSSKPVAKAEKESPKEKPKDTK